MESTRIWYYSGSRRLIIECVYVLIVENIMFQRSWTSNKYCETVPTTSQQTENSDIFITAQKSPVAVCHAASDIRPFTISFVWQSDAWDMQEVT